mmetsp:Transcript_16149/g.25058  ORF Transcript_16149/g.25058 Transcript_16149/m.25058 type:complete len:186 (+) Transcript_16149:46-603(+)
MRSIATAAWCCFLATWWLSTFETRAGEAPNAPSAWEFDVLGLESLVSPGMGGNPCRLTQVNAGIGLFNPAMYQRTSCIRLRGGKEHRKTSKLDNLLAQELEDDSQDPTYADDTDDPSNTDQSEETLAFEAYLKTFDDGELSSENAKDIPQCNKSREELYEEIKNYQTPYGQDQVLTTHLNMSFSH